MGLLGLLRLTVVVGNDSHSFTDACGSICCGQLILTISIVANETCIANVRTPDVTGLDSGSSANHRKASIGSAFIKQLSGCLYFAATS